MFHIKIKSSSPLAYRRSSSCRAFSQTLSYWKVYEVAVGIILRREMQGMERRRIIPTASLSKGHRQTGSWCQSVFSKLAWREL